MYFGAGLDHKGVIMTEVKKIAKKESVKSKQASEPKVKKATKAKIDEAVKDVKVRKPLAKAGKRSAKAVKETEEKLTKDARKADKDIEVSKPTAKPSTKPARSKLERRSKKYQTAAKLVEADKVYELKDAIDTALKTSTVKFDATVELHINLNVDPRQADQNIRGTVVLPAGTGKSARVAVFGDTEDVASGKKAGADIAAGDELLQQLDNGKIVFDVLIATPKSMAKLGKYAKLLGPKGLMPNPKSGTVTTDVSKAVKEAKAGKVEFRVDGAGIVHVATGKVSFGTDKIQENIEVLMSAIKSSKPASVKGSLVRSAYIATSMGPSVKFAV